MWPTIALKSNAPAWKPTVGGKMPNRNDNMPVADLIKSSISPMLMLPLLRPVLG